MKKQVVKLGGSVLLDKVSFNNIENFLKNYENPIVVVSAFNGITNKLVKIVEILENSFNLNKISLKEIEDFHFNLIQNVFENPDFVRKVYVKVGERLNNLKEIIEGICLIKEISISTKNKIISFGERLSSLILKEFLSSHGLNVEENLPENFGLWGKTLSEFTSIDLRKSKKSVVECFKNKNWYVVPGFYCVAPTTNLSNNTSQISLLGRGGSDYTASALGNILNAETVDFWKDCNGFQSADPKIIEKASQINKLSYQEAAELAYFGAKIFHPSAIEPLKEKSIPLRLFKPENFSNLQKPLTLIGKEEFVEHQVVKSVTFTDDIGVLKITGSNVGAIPGIISNISTHLTENNINIKSIVTSQTSINLLLDRVSLEKSFLIISKNYKGKVKNISVKRDISLIAAVGQGILHKHGIAHKLFAAVSNIGVNVEIISAGASETAVYFIVNENDKLKTIKAIHKEFFK